jgi:DNA-binding transcriptional MerR regulator
MACNRFGAVSTPNEPGWKLDELAKRAGVSARTVRYYVQRGLLPPPDFRGKDTVYTREHLYRLEAIRKLQEQFLPLDAIQAELSRRTLDEIRELAEGRGTVHLLKLTQNQPATESLCEPMRASETSPVSRWQRFEMAPGLEIHLSDSADEQTRELADKLRSIANDWARNGRTVR